MFLSYASQDAEAAQRICDALHAAGVEVWFDQSKLAGGDAWDAKIRGQINACALFVPVISAATQARREGYFRLEWKLAAQRTHMMSERTAFLLPVVLDATRDAEADVPGEFRAVQWTRLPNGETNAAFGARVKTLLGSDVARVSRPVDSENTGQETRATMTKRRSPLVLAAATLAIVAAIGAALFIAKKSSPSAAAPLANDRSIAVLPFTNMSDDQENAFFADGVHEDLLTNLTNLKGLKVVSLTSVMLYRNPTKDLRQIARELGVAYILEGSVRRAGNQIRVTGQLIHAATDEHVWAHKYDRELKDIFAVQTDLAREIADSLHAVLSPAEAAGLAAPPTKNIEAYVSFQKARVLLRSNFSERELREKIIPQLEHAVALDADYAAAWAELCHAHAVLYNISDRTPTRLAQAKDAFAHAARLAPNAYAVLQAGIDVASIEGDGKLADDRRRQIIELFSGRAESHLMQARDAKSHARWADAQTSFRAALRLDPRNPEVVGSYFLMLDEMRRWDEAEPVAATLAEVDPNNLNLRLTAASMSFRRSGSTAQLKRLLAELPRDAEAQEKAIPIRNRIMFLTADWAGLAAHWREVGLRFKTGSPAERSSRMLVAEAFLKLGDPASARPLLEQERNELMQQLQIEPENIAKWNNLGVTRAMLGDRDGAQSALDKASQLIAAQRREPYTLFGVRLGNAIARSWIDEKSAVIQAIGPLLREPSPRAVNANVRVLRVTWETMPLHGDPEFEAMLNDLRNNAPLF